jgi:hypothetical protein
MLNWCQMFLIFVRIYKDFSIFLDCPPRILGGITWRPQKEPPISNSKIGFSYRSRLVVVTNTGELVNRTCCTSYRPVIPITAVWTGSGKQKPKRVYELDTLQTSARPIGMSLCTLSTTVWTSGGVDFLSEVAHLGARWKKKSLRLSHAKACCKARPKPMRVQLPPCKGGVGVGGFLNLREEFIFFLS